VVPQQAAEELMAANNFNRDNLNVFLEAGSTESVLAIVEAGREFPLFPAG
jgi:hypothetical protein